MFWPSLFLVNITQGLFLVSLLAYKESKNRIASRLIITLLVLIIFTNLSYLVIRTDLRYYVPQLFAIPFGMMMLYGPLIYFYSKSIIDNSFHWKKKYWLHSIPYLVLVFNNSPLFLMTRNEWNEFITIYLAGGLEFYNTEKVLFGLQHLHLFIYLLFTFRLIQSAKKNYANIQYTISLSYRIKWLKELSLSFLLFLLGVFSLYIFVVIQGKYNPISNYNYTVFTTAIIYFIAYKLVLNPELIRPAFTQKYQAYMQFTGEEGDKYVQKLKSFLMIESKIFINPDLKLSLLAEHVGLPSHQLSKLINEKFGKSYNDFVNEYRVQEFISRINNTDFRSYSIYGVALDVGFNSKSSFNTAFKKITGKKPSEFKRPS